MKALPSPCHMKTTCNGFFVGMSIVKPLFEEFSSNISAFVSGYGGFRPFV